MHLQSIKLAAECRSRTAIERAFNKLRSSRRTMTKGMDDRKRQMMLQRMWGDTQPPRADGSEWVQVHEDPGILTVRTQLLGLQDSWRSLGHHTAKRFMMRCYRHFQSAMLRACALAGQAACRGLADGSGDLLRQAAGWGPPSVATTHWSHLLNLAESSGPSRLPLR